MGFGRPQREVFESDLFGLIETGLPLPRRAKFKKNIAAIIALFFLQAAYQFDEITRTKSIV